MPRNKRIYIRDEHQAALKEFADAGGNASELFAQALLAYIEKKREAEARKAGAKYERIVVEVETDEGTIVKKAFEGRWLVSDVESDERNTMAGNFWSVAETKKGRIVVTVSDRFDNTGQFEVFEGADEFKESDHIPEDVKSAALAELGSDYVQELDI